MNPLPWWKPEVLATALAERYGRQGLVWLDGDGSKLGRHAVLAAGPEQVLRCEGLPGDPSATNPFEALSVAFSGKAGHWLGWLSYEAGAWVEPAEHWQAPQMAVLWAARYSVVIELDLQQQTIQLLGEGPRHDELMGLLHEPAPLIHPVKTSIQPEAWHWHSGRRNYKQQVEKVRAWIAEGDLFQANLTDCAEQTLTQPADPLALYQRLRQGCPAPFGGVMLASRKEAVLSASPERFLQVDSQGLVETRPIKGTRPRNSNPMRDADAAAELVTSPKDRAENVMIVDLMRNDLGRVCSFGSINVPQLVGLESYPQVHHLTSVVTGVLKQPLDTAGLLQACWPGGSITGAPKIRACERLSSLEPVPRGPYCGSFFHRRPNGRFDSNILIRSVLMLGKRLRVHGGCGIVADSDPQLEADELGWKVQPLIDALA